MLIWICLNVIISCLGIFASIFIYKRWHKEVLIVDFNDEVIEEDLKRQSSVEEIAGRSAVYADSIVLSCCPYTVISPFSALASDDSTLRKRIVDANRT
jgi:hypothetical protein